MLVSEHIRRNVYTISPSADFREALEAMIEHKTNGLIVVDKDNKPLGAIDSFMLIKNMVPSYLLENPDLARFEPDGVFYKALSKSLHKKVKDMMVDLNGISVKEDDRMIIAAALASKHDFRYIPVVDEKGELAGLVSRTDIKRAMASLVSIKDDPESK
ncbi:MAG: CBS domain-containing protein [Candidatus Kerfeldbacteria bacterium]